MNLTVAFGARRLSARRYGHAKAVMKRFVMSLWLFWQRVIDRLTAVAETIYPKRRRILFISLMMLPLLFGIPIALWVVGLGEIIERSPGLLLTVVSIPMLGFVWLTGLHVLARWFEPTKGALSLSVLDTTTWPVRYSGYVFRQLAPGFLVFWMLSPIYVLVLMFLEIGAP